MRKIIYPILFITIGSAFFWTCNKSFSGYEEVTATASFQQSEVIIPDTMEIAIPVIISLSDINYYSAYTVYVSVNDTASYLKNNLMSISNAMYKEPDYLSGDFLSIYKVVVEKGTKIAAIMVKPEVNELEEIPHSLSFKIIPDPLKQVQPKGADFYRVEKGRDQVTVTINPIRPLL